MFNKLKSFSEDVAKSFNEIQQGEPARNIDNIRQLKNGSNILNTQTPDSKDLQQPEDDSESQTGSQTQLNQEGTPAQTPPPIATSGPLKDIDMELLPPVVRAKLKKFVKYEEKYPVLLDAYKTEKRKGDLVLAFEKVLKDNTPVSLIADAGELVDYLKSIHEKTELTEQELRRKSGELTQLSKRLADAEKTVRYTEQALDKALKKSDTLESEIESLRQESRSVTREATPQNDSDPEHQKLIVSLREQLGSAQAELGNAKQEKAKLIGELDAAKADHKSVSQELESLKAEKSTIFDQLNSLKTDFDALAKELESMKSEKESIADRLNTSNEEKNRFEKNVSDLESKISALEKQIEVIKTEKDEAQSKAVQTPSLQVEAPSQQSRSGGNKKKKNKKGKGASASAEAVPETSDANGYSDEWKSKYDELSQKYNDLVTEKDSLASELSQSRREVAEKKEEIETLNDMLRETGNDLVAAKDELKEMKLDTTSKEKLERYEKLEKQMEDTKKELEHLKRESDIQLEKAKAESAEQMERVRTETKEEAEKLQQVYQSEIQKLKLEADKSTGIVKDLKGQLTKVNKELEDSRKEITSLNLERLKLNQRIDELSKAKSVDSSLKLEIASLQSSVSHKDELIKEFKDQSEKRAKERDTLKATISQLENSNATLQESKKSLVLEKSDLINKQEITNQRINSLNNELSKLQVSKHEVVSELDGLKSKYDSMLKSKANSSDEVQSYKQQYEELSMKLKEAHNKIESLEDELSEAKLMLQERTRESSTIRKLLLEAEERSNIECANLKNEIRSINAEKSELEASLQGSLKHKQREIEELKATVSESSNKIKELTGQIDALKKKYEPLLNETAVSPDAAKKTKDLESTIDELRTSLQSSSAKVKEYENLNRMLKKLNEESSLKVERLLKNYKHVTQQYRQMQNTKTRPPDLTRSPSEQSATEKSKENDTNTAYLKNVLFGFFEHRDQREQLLPVVKTLFQLDDAEESKLMNALK